MKKTDLILIGVVLVIVVLALFSTKGSSAQDEIDYPVVLAGEVGLNEITYSKYVELVESEEPFVVVIERAGCYYCQQYMPILKEYTEEKKIAVTYIDTDNLTDEEMQELSTKNKYLKSKQWGTPTTLFMKGNKIIDSIAGYVDGEAIDAFFKDRVVMG